MEAREERIMRMNCLGNAIKYWEKADIGTTQIIETAQKFEKYVKGDDSGESRNRTTEKENQRVQKPTRDL